MFRDIALPPGDSAIRVQFERVESVRTSTDSSPDASDEARHSTAMDNGRRRRELEERVRGREEAIPPSLSLERRLRLISRQVVLVTYDADLRTFRLIEEGPR